MIYDKTEKGREEIATRKYQLPPRLRTLLVMIDGRNPLDTVLRNIAGLGLNGESVNLLVANEYIHLVSGGEEAANEPEHPAAGGRPASLRRPPGVRRPHPLQSAQAEGEAEPMPIAADTAAAVGEAEQYRAVYEFYNQTIKSTLGLRGFALQLKVEKAANLEAFRELRTPYLEAVFKAKGAELARSLRDRLDSLLGGAPAADAFAALA
ncbi:MAG: hypothetical protein ACXWKJ_20635 [Telluria sp.]